MGPINEEVVGPITPGRGLPQGDPLSPYLFILCAEGLSSPMLQANREGTLHGGKVCRRSLMISYLLFADDCLLFCRATRSKAQALKSVLTLYEQISGQAINFSKSETFYSSNVDAETKFELG